MNKLLFIVILLAMAPTMSSAISCYVGYGGTYTTLPDFDVCYSWTIGSVPWKSGAAGYTCSSSVPIGYLCCSTNLCNGAKINGVSILMTSAAVIIALFQAI